MTARPESEPDWGPRYRLVAAEKWKAKSAAMGQHVTEALVKYAQPAPGMQVLDLASGTGEPAISLALAVGPRGHVTALDLSADLLEVAAQRAQVRGLTNFSTQQADAHRLPFPDDSFDLVTSRFGVMFFRDPVAAFREVRRVLRPGARACFLAWAAFEQPYFQSMFGAVHQHVGGPLLQPGDPNPFRFAEAGSLSAVFRSAGFSSVAEEAKTLPWAWPGPPEEVWEQVQTTAVVFRPLLERVTSDQWPRVHADVHASVKRYFDGEKVAFGASVVFASGTK